MYDIIDHKIVQREFNERLQHAAQENRARRLQAGQPGRVDHIRQGLSNVLVAVGQKLKAQTQPAVMPQA